MVDAVVYRERETTLLYFHNLSVGLYYRLIVRKVKRKLSFHSSVLQFISHYLRLSFHSIS